MDCDAHRRRTARVGYSILLWLCVLYLCKRYGTDGSDLVWYALLVALASAAIASWNAAETGARASRPLVLTNLLAHAAYWLGLVGRSVSSLPVDDPGGGDGWLLPVIAYPVWALVATGSSLLAARFLTRHCRATRAH